MIEIGPEAIDREGTSGSTYEQTMIAVGNPAKNSGKITTVQLWLTSNAENFKVGTFYHTTDNYFTCRAYTVLGDVEAGSLQTFSGLNIPVEAGDYIGWYWLKGGIEVTISGGAGIYHNHYDYMGQGGSHSYEFTPNLTLSIHGIGYIILDEGFLGLFFADDNQQISEAPETTHAVLVSLRADLNEESDPIKLYALACSGYVISGVEIIPTGATQDEWDLAFDDNDSPSDWQGYGATLALGQVEDFDKYFWVKAKAVDTEAPANDVSVTLVASGIACAE